MFHFLGVIDPTGSRLCQFLVLQYPRVHLPIPVRDLTSPAGAVRTKLSRQIADSAILPDSFR